MFRMILHVAAVVMLLTGTATAGLLPSLGVKAGLNFSSVNMDALDTSTRSGFVGGVFANLTLPGLSVQAEALYTVKGSKKGSGLGIPVFEYREHLLQIPMLARFALPIPLVAPAVYAGPAVSFPLKGQFNTGSGWTDARSKAEGQVWSLIIGADVTLISSLVLDLRFDWGLSKIRETELGDVIDTESSIKDRTITATIGYKF
jgi:opacity protein-like surface antigen